MTTFDLDQARDLPKGTITIESEGERSYMRIGEKRVPLSITPRQLWLALIRRGIYEPQVMAIIESLPDPKRYAALAELKGHVYERTSPWIDQIGAALGLDADAIDDVFVEGAEL
jgi:hypothetical protein